MSRLRVNIYQGEPKVGCSLLSLTRKKRICGHLGLTCIQFWLLSHCASLCVREKKVLHISSRCLLKRWKSMLRFLWASQQRASGAAAAAGSHLRQVCLFLWSSNLWVILFFVVLWFRLVSCLFCLVSVLCSLRLSFLFGVLLVLDVFPCLQASSQTFSSFSSSHERSAKCMEFRFCIRVFRRVVGTSSVLCSLNCPFFRVHLQFWICCFGFVCISSSILQNTFFFFTKMICQVARSWNFGFGLGFLDLLSVLLECSGVWNVLFCVGCIYSLDFLFWMCLCVLHLAEYLLLLHLKNLQSSIAMEFWFWFRVFWTLFHCRVAISWVLMFSPRCGLLSCFRVEILDSDFFYVGLKSCSTVDLWILMVFLSSGYRLGVNRSGSCLNHLIWLCQQQQQHRQDWRAVGTKRAKRH